MKSVINLAGVALSLTVAMGCAGTSLAQQAHTLGAVSKEQACVFDALSPAEITTLASAQVAPTPKVEADADLVLEKAGAACAATHKWDMRLRVIAEQYASSTAVRTWLRDALGKATASNPAALAGVDAAWTALPRADKVKFSGRNWFGDQAFIGRVRTALTTAGVPQDDAAVRPAIGILWATANATGAQISWDLLKRRGEIVPAKAQ